MTSPAKSRSRSIAGVDPRMGQIVNDNTPPAFPGHELSDLDGVPRQPAAEAVAHYGRLTQIASYPMHPDVASAPSRTAPVMDALPEPTRKRRPAAGRRTTFACLGSILFHLVLLAALTTATVTVPEDPVEEAGDSVSVIMLGDSDADQLASGEESKEPQPEPDAVVAEAVEPDVVQPTTSQPTEVQPVEQKAAETPPVDTVQPVQPSESLPEPVQPDQVQPTQTVTQVSPETVVSPAPEVLAAQVPAAPTVAQPMATEIQPEEMKPAEAPPAEVVPSATQPETAPPPETLQPLETTEAVIAPPPEVVAKPIERPKPPAKPVEKPKDVVKKQPPKPVKVRSGSKGDSERNSTKGSSEGTEVAQADGNSLSAGNRQGSGSAAVANYPGKVQSRIRRSVRVPSEYRRVTASTTVRVRLTIGSGGELSSLSLARSSGVADLDNAVMEGVRRAAPFPPLPPEWGKPSWSFTQEVQVTGN